MSPAPSALPDASFWRGRRVFVTGDTGFKGAWLALWLQRLGAQVAGYALDPPTDPSLFELASIASSIEHRRGDVRDLDALENATRESSPEIVFHLAAQSLVRASYADPVATYATNVMGTVNVLEAARRVPSVAAVVIVTSDKCYAEDPSRLPYGESDPMGGRDPYSSSKGCAELVTSAYAQSFLAARGCAVASVRAGNVIGGGDWAGDRLVADLMRGFVAGVETVLRNPDAIRPWQHVLDPLCGYLLAAERIVREAVPSVHAWNFGPGPESEVSVGEVAASLARLWSEGAGLPNARAGAGYRIAREPGAPHEAAVLRLRADKASRELDWSPRWPLQEALARTVEWYAAYARGDDMGEFSRTQIAAYCDTAAGAVR